MPASIRERRSVFTTLTLVFLALLLGGCGDGRATPTATANAAATPAQAIAAEPTAETVEVEAGAESAVAMPGPDALTAPASFRESASSIGMI